MTEDQEKALHAVLTEEEKQVHHAVVRLYEVHDFESVTAVDVSKLLRMPWREVRTAMVSLQSKRVLDLDCSEENVVTRCDNLSYYPLQEDANA